MNESTPDAQAQRPVPTQFIALQVGRRGFTRPHLSWVLLGAFNRRYRS